MAKLHAMPAAVAPLPQRHASSRFVQRSSKKLRRCLSRSCTGLLQVTEEAPENVPYTGPAVANLCEPDPMPAAG